MMPKRKLMTYGKETRQIIDQTTSNFADFHNDDPSPNKKQDASMATPSEEDILTVVAIALCEREVALRYLKAKNNNVEQAVTALLDNENIATESWDDSVWAADRNDANLQPLGASTAPTRGPSPAGSLRHPTSREQEDAQMAAAMHASYSQEQGVIKADGTTAPIYGPEYNPQQWALVKSTHTATEVIPDVNAVDRRSDGQPRFLKSSSDYLPNFFTICHSIPAARKLMLLHDYTRTTYGSNPDWWRGHEILLPRIVHTADGTPTDPQLARYDDFIVETQRLMAFLDASNRAYATTSNLEKYSGMAYHGKSQTSSLRTNVSTFISELARATHTISGKADVEEIFELCAGDESGEIAKHIIEALELDIEGPRSLSAVLDDLLWDIDADGEPEDRYVEKLPGVLIMRCKQHTTSTLQLKAPGTIFLDKYLKENLDELRPARQEISFKKKRLDKIDEVEKQLKTWQHQQKPIDTMILLAQTKAQFQSNRTPNGYEPGVLDVADELQKVMDSINNKLLILAEEKCKAQAALAELSASPESLQEHRYTLAGIATKPGITYVLQSQAEDEQSLLDHGDETPQGMQWWRIEYSATGTTATMNRTKVPSYDALAAIEHEHNTALLVYASDDALSSHHLTPLSQELQEFIRADNEIFERELQAIPPPGYAFDVSMNDADRPRESIERKLSMDSLTAHHDSPDMGDFDIDPTQHAGFNLGYGNAEYDDQPLAEIPPPIDGIDLTEVSHSEPGIGIPGGHFDAHRRDTS